MRALRGLVLLLAFGFQFAHAAYISADLVTLGEDPQLGTHLIISGKGMEDGRAWLEIAHAQALMYADKQHHGKIRIISAIMNDSDVTLMNQWGYTHINLQHQDFTEAELVAAIEQVPSIASMDMIGHNGAILGFALEDYDHRFFLSAIQSLASYRNHFTKDSYVRLFGCNTGWNLAPAVAQYLQVPAAGSLTSEDIQFLQVNQNWYFDEDGLYPPGGDAVSNKVSFGKAEVCNHSGCERLKTVSTHYNGKHGNYQGTVPFMKFFCGTIPQADCFRRMALSTRTLLGVVNVQNKPSKSDFARVLADQFCNASGDTAPYDDCVAKVVAQITSPSSVLPSTYSPTGEEMLTCSFTKCQFTTKCGADCDLIGDFSHPSTVFVDELNAYKLGYDLWN